MRSYFVCVNSICREGCLVDAVAWAISKSEGSRVPVRIFKARAEEKEAQLILEVIDRVVCRVVSFQCISVKALKKRAPGEN